MATDQQIDGSDLWKTILDDAGFESLSEVPVGISFRWFPIAGSKDFSIFEVGKPLPINKNLIAFAMFQDENEARIYCCSVPNESPAPPHLITLSKTAPTMFVSMLALDCFIDQVSSELQASANSNDDADMLAEAIQGYLKNGDKKMLEAALADYQGEGGDDEELDDEPEETEPNGSGDDVAPPVV